MLHRLFTPLKVVYWLLVERVQAVVVVAWAVLALEPGWQILPVLLALLTLAIISLTRDVLATVRTALDLRDYLSAFRHLKLRSLTLEGCEAAIRMQSQEPERLAKGILPGYHKWVPLKVRIFCFDVNGEAGSFPSTIKTFQSTYGFSTMILNGDPRQMNPLQLLQLLHEFGHIEMTNLAYGKQSKAINWVVCMVLLMLLCNIDGGYLLWFSILACLFVLIDRVDRNRFEFAAVNAEINADNFALSRADPRWIEGVDANALARIFCEHEKAEPRGALNRILFKHAYAEQVALRRQQFVENVERLRQGECRFQNSEIGASDILLTVRFVLLTATAAIALWLLYHSYDPAALWVIWTLAALLIPVWIVFSLLANFVTRFMVVALDERKAP